MKNRFTKRKRKKVLIISLTIILIILLSLLAYYLISNRKTKHLVVFTLEGEEVYDIEYGSEYTELGAKVLVDDIDKSSNIKIDASALDISKLGEYKVKYYIFIDKLEYVSYRIVKVVDNINPIITLKGNSKIEVLLNEEYIDEGATALDNYDGDISFKVTTEGTVDTSKVGEYKIIYKVSDSSNNTSKIERIVTVKNPNKIVAPNNSENKEEQKEITISNYSNTITLNKFTSSGFYIEGYKKENNGSFKLKLTGESEYYFNLISNGNNKYKGNISLEGIPNGTYNLYIVSSSEEKLLNKMIFIDKIVRSKIGSKLVTFIYDNDEVKIRVEDFAYKYDVIIDPGHGGSDVGASNEYIYEKEMNLTVSLYEKCRFQSHGFSVYMTRKDDSYGSGLGDSTLSRLHRRAYEMGYYGVVSKIVYSNHHNFITYGNYSGYEILLPDYLTSGEMTNELSIANKFNEIYPLKENHLRFYATDYDTEKKYSKLSGTVYSFKDNYAVNRIPYKLFNVKSVIYEGAYLSSTDDYNWYWKEANWIKVSEAKLEVYINYLGGSYNPDNFSCLN